MINSVTIQGRLTADPELNRTDNDIAVCNFCIAYDRSYTSSEEKITDFFDCVAWRARAEFLERNFGKGDMIAVTGKLFTESYTDRNGANRKAVKILVSDIAFSGRTKKQKEKNINEDLAGLAVPEDVAAMADDEDLPF